MIEASTPSIPANPATADVTLSAEDIWRAFVWKAEFAHLFAEPIKSCTVLERFDDGFLRKIVHEDSQGRDILYERIFLDPGTSVTYLRLNGPVGGQIINAIDVSGDLSVVFSFTLALEGEDHRSRRELDYEKEFMTGYIRTAEATLEAAREYLRSGVDPTASAVHGS